MRQQPSNHLVLGGSLADVGMAGGGMEGGREAAGDFIGIL